MSSYHKNLADGFFVFASIAVLAAMVGWLIGDVWLASTQWLLVAIMFLQVAVYVKLSAAEDEEIIKEYHRQARSARTAKPKRKKSKHVSFRLTD